MAIVDAVVRTFVVLVFGAAVIFFIRWIHPRLRQQRHRRWEEAGLLPHQVDPYAPREDGDPTDSGRRPS